MSETTVLSEEELDIIGDIDKNEEPSDVTIYCKGIRRNCVAVWFELYHFTIHCWMSMLPG